MKGKTGNEELTMVEKHKIIKKFIKDYSSQVGKPVGDYFKIFPQVLRFWNQGPLLSFLAAPPQV